jgi:pyrroline-5-carboxylate reductase
MAGQSVAILGGGHMGRALLSGLLRRGTRPEEVSVADVSPAARAALRHDFAVSAEEDSRAAITEARLVVIAVKPQYVASLIKSLEPVLRQTRPVVVSIAGGIRIASLTAWCGAGVPIVRAMPNRPAFVGAGVTGIFALPDVGPPAREAASRVLSAVGEVVWLQDEAALDVVTALSGSGPAYLFLMAEAMMQAAIELGLEPEAARKLAVGTLYGAGALAHGSDGDLVRLRQEVTSEGGTTEAALKVFAAAHLTATVGQALAAAANRSRELAQQFG